MSKLSLHEESQVLRRRLVDNAFDFLRCALDEFEQTPKYSVIHFHAAMELLLKARLMAEHWSLVVADRAEPNWAKFKAGDFVSVNLAQAARRLANVVQSGLSTADLSAFQAVAQHRNRTIHFFHQAHAAEESQVALEQIAKEQLRAWYGLNQLLRVQWAAHFEPWREQIDGIEAKLKRHREFLDLIYQAVKPELESARKGGASIQPCRVCSYDAVMHQDELNRCYRTTCKVCGDSCGNLRVECGDCKQVVEFKGDGWAKCADCGKSYEPSHLAELLEDHGAAYIAVKDGGGWWQGNCSDCDGYHTVVQTETEVWIATCCLTEHTDLSWCGWCNEPNTGDMDDSYYLGCNFCDGKAGWDKDD